MASHAVQSLRRDFQRREILRQFRCDPAWVWGRKELVPQTEAGRPKRLLPAQLHVFRLVLPTTMMLQEAGHHPLLGNHPELAAFGKGAISFNSSELAASRALYSWSDISILTAVRTGRRLTESRICDAAAE